MAGALGLAQRPPRQLALEFSWALAHRLHMFRQALDRAMRGWPATGMTATGRQAIGITSGMARLVIRGGFGWIADLPITAASTATVIGTLIETITSAGSSAFCCLHHAAPPNWRGRFFRSFSV